MPQNNPCEGSSFALFSLVSLYGFPRIYQRADREETRLDLLGDYKGFGPLSEEHAKSCYICWDLTRLMRLLSFLFRRSHPIFRYCFMWSFKTVFLKKLHLKSDLNTYFTGLMEPSFNLFLLLFYFQCPIQASRSLMILILILGPFPPKVFLPQESPTPDLGRGRDTGVQDRTPFLSSYWQSGPHNPHTARLHVPQPQDCSLRTTPSSKDPFFPLVWKDERRKGRKGATEEWI